MAPATALGLIVALAPALAAAPQGADERLVVERPQPAVIRLGDSATVALRVDTQKNPPAPTVPTVAGLRLRLRLLGSEQSTSIIHGRRTYRRSLNYTLDIHPLREGKFTIPPFEVDVGSSKKKTAPIVIEVTKDIVGEKYAYLEIAPSHRRVYVHEPIRFRVDYGVDKRLTLANERVGQRVLPGVILQAPWLDRIKGLEPIQGPELQKGIILGLNSEAVAVEYDAEHRRDAQIYHGFRLTRSFLPTRTGTFQLSAPVLSYTVVKREGLNRRFGFPLDRGETQTFYVYGAPLEFEVVGLPVDGRPEPFYNAVGRFSVGAALDKRKVAVGDSVKLELTISGSGNLEFLEVPELGDLPGFHTLGKIEKRDQEKVTVTYDLTPQTVSVQDVPAIGWNYFDTTPGVERYVKVKTDPLPIRVEPLEGQATLPPLPDGDDKTVEMGVDDIYDMKPAAGSAPLLLPAPPSSATALLAGLLPWVFFAMTALFAQRLRRRRGDVAGQRSRGAARRLKRALAAGTDPHTALVGYLADRLACEPAAVIGEDLGKRLQAAGVDQELADAVGRHVEAGVSARYAGGEAASVLGTDTVRDLVQRLEGTTIKPLAAALGLCVLLAAASLSAQERPASAGEAAYRQGEYDAAVAAFAQQAAAGDRRAAYNLGNSHYRQGRFAEALAAYESARLATPRDPQLLFNIRLTRQKLDLVEAGGEPFLTTLAELRDALTPWERLWLCAGLNLLAAGLVLLGGRRLRAIGVVVLFPALLVLLEVAWWGPVRPPKGIVTVPKVALRAEPKAELEALMTIRAGVAVAVLQEGPAWTRVRLRDRQGYLPNDSLVVVR
jgi:tetratricopeptide (TPR) repeat protein